MSSATTPRASVLTLGNFDGVHLGHRALIEAALEQADLAEANPTSSGLGRPEVVAITFDPPPSSVLHGTMPPRLCPQAMREARLLACGADRVVWLTPDKAMLAQSPEQFVQAMVERFHPVAWVEGEGFRFGQGRAGDMERLAELGAAHGFVAVPVPPKYGEVAGACDAPISSSLIRWLLGRGRVEDAGRLLGGPVTLTAKIVQGDQRGRTLGIPTANMDAKALDGLLLPADGVYAAMATLPHEPAPIPAAVSIGEKPTFDGRRLTVEAHLIDHHPEPFDALYGQPMTLTFTRWLREQRPFPGVDALVTQLHRDIRRAVEVLATPV